MGEKNKKILKAFHKTCTLCLRDDDDLYINFLSRITQLMVSQPTDMVDDYIISKYVVQFKNKLRLIRSLEESINTYIDEIEIYINHLELLSPPGTENLCSGIDIGELQRILDGSAFLSLTKNALSISELYGDNYSLNDTLPDIDMNGHFTSLFLEVELIAMTSNLNKISIMLFEAIDDEYLKVREAITKKYLKQLKVV